MLFRIIGICALPFLLLFSVSARGEDGTVQKETPTFTNQDIEKYKKPSDSEPLPVKTDRTAENRGKLLKAKEQHEKEYWCKTATRHKKKIEKAQEDIAEAEKGLSGEDGPLSYKKRSALQNRLKNAKRRLKYEEKELAEIEDEAYRKGVPPGWVRCQFE
jgi:hypothetical protein